MPKIKIPRKKLIVKIIAIAIVTLNGIGYGGAYLITHYKDYNSFGLGLPRSKNYNSPADFNLKYITKKIPINQKEWLDSWLIKSSATKSQGIVILFHGKDSNKSSLLDAAKIFNSLNYDTLLIDFRGSGKSSGNETTIGVKEAKDVVAVVNYLAKLDWQKPVILYGISMGSAAILRAIAKYQIQPDAIILELPFTSLLSAIKTRLRNSHLVAFPLGELVVFWVGIQHGFNGFGHNPREDAKKVNCPTLILSGKRDRTVAIAEVEQLYQNLNVAKKMVVFPQAEHEILARSNSALWTKTIQKFLNSL